MQYQMQNVESTLHYTARNNRPCLAKLFPLLHNVCRVRHRSRRTRAGPGHFSSPILCCVSAGSWWSRGDTTNICYVFSSFLDDECGLLVCVVVFSPLELSDLLTDLMEINFQMLIPRL